jgi:hypothetical protein
MEKGFVLIEVHFWPPYLVGQSKELLILVVLLGKLIFGAVTLMHLVVVVLKNHIVVLDGHFFS